LRYPDPIGVLKQFTNHSPYDPMVYASLAATSKAIRKFPNFPKVTMSAYKQKIIDLLKKMQNANRSILTYDEILTVYGFQRYLDVHARRTFKYEKEVEQAMLIYNTYMNELKKISGSKPLEAALFIAADHLERNIKMFEEAIDQPPQEELPADFMQSVDMDFVNTAKRILTDLRSRDADMGKSILQIIQEYAFPDTILNMGSLVKQLDADATKKRSKHIKIKEIENENDFYDYVIMWFSSRGGELSVMNIKSVHLKAFMFLDIYAPILVYFDVIEKLYRVAYILYLYTPKRLLKYHHMNEEERDFYADTLFLAFRGDRVHIEERLNYIWKVVKQLFKKKTKNIYLDQNKIMLDVVGTGNMALVIYVLDPEMSRGPTHSDLYQKNV
jgi:hypothetical protein